jgi:hypothetical protein
MESTNRRNNRSFIWSCFPCGAKHGKKHQEVSKIKTVSPEKTDKTEKPFKHLGSRQFLKIIPEGGSPQRGNEEQKQHVEEKRTNQKVIENSHSSSFGKRFEHMLRSERNFLSIDKNSSSPNLDESTQKKVHAYTHACLQNLLINGEAYIKFVDEETRRVPPNRNRMVYPHPEQWINFREIVSRPYAYAPANVVSQLASLVYDAETNMGKILNDRQELIPPVCEGDQVHGVPVQVFCIDGRYLIPQPTDKACLTACAHMLLLQHGCESPAEAVSALTKTRDYDRRMETEEIVMQLRARLKDEKKTIFIPSMPGNKKEFIDVLSKHLATGPCIVDNGGHAQILYRVREDSDGKLILLLGEPYHGQLVEVKNSSNPINGMEDVMNDDKLIYMGDIDVYKCQSIFLKNVESSVEQAS